MRRSFRYFALAGSGVLSCVVAYKLNTSGGYGTGVAYAAGESPAEILRSGLANDTKEWNKNWDFREPGDSSRNAGREKHRVPSLAERFGDSDQTTVTNKPTATRHLVFIRHGQYAKADKDEDKVLTSLGRQQAEATASRLEVLHSEKYKVDKIVISTMTRARETGEIIRKSLPNVPFEYCDFIREGAPCRPDPPSSTWRPENCEIFQDGARIEAAFRKYFHRADPGQKEDSIEVYVCHANVIRYFVCRALQFPPEGWLRMSVANCGVTWLSISPSGRVSLRSMGDTGHLLPNMITTS